MNEECFDSFNDTILRSNVSTLKPRLTLLRVGFSTCNSSLALEIIVPRAQGLTCTNTKGIVTGWILDYQEHIQEEIEKEYEKVSVLYRFPQSYVS